MQILAHPLEDLNRLADAVFSIIDFEESRLHSGRVCVLPRVDEELDELRTKYAGLETMLVCPFMRFFGQSIESILMIFGTGSYRPEY